MTDSSRLLERPPTELETDYGQPGDGKAAKVAAVCFCLLVIGLCIPAIVWAFGQQKLTDHGNTVIVFNTEQQPLGVRVNGEAKTLAPRETWRVRVGDGTHQVSFADDTQRSFTLGWDSYSVLVPSSPVALALVDASACYANLDTGNMVRATNRIEQLIAPSDYTVLENSWVLSPFEDAPDSILGNGPPRLTVLLPEAVQGNPERARDLVAAELGIEVTK